MSLTRHPAESEISSQRDHGEIRRLLLGREGRSAARACARALARAPQDHILLHLAALAALQCSNLSRARAFLLRCLARRPSFGPAHQDLGNLHLRQSEYAKARDAYERALAYGQRSAVLLTNLAVVCLRQGDHDTGLARLREALRVDPGHVEAWANLAVVCQKIGAPDQALQHFHKALRLDPDNLVAASGLAALCGELNRHAEALSIYRRLARELAPEDRAILYAYRQYARRACMWAEVSRIDAALQRLAAESSKARWSGEDPHESCTSSSDQQRNLAAARQRSREVAARMGPPIERARRAVENKRIRIGYLFADVGNGPGGQLTRSMFALHDREKFEVAMFSSQPDDGSQLAADIKAGCDRFHDCHGWSDRRVAAQIVDEQIDILVDLDGWTRHNRLAAAALRPCDVQVTFLGCPGTSGADFIDYIVTDSVVVPPASHPYLSEAPILMPDCYLVCDGAPPASPHRPRRSECGLPERGIVFCCFSQTYKIEEAVFACWMRILRQVPDSVLWLWDSQGLARDNLRAAARQHGIAPQRLIFADRMAKPEHLRRLELADIALDTRTCNGHTTTVDLLWAGVPVVTQTGRHWASRVSTSILRALGQLQLAVDTEDAYEELILRLARDPQFLAATKERVRVARRRAPLFDTARFTRNLDAAYRAIWSRHCAGAAPAALSFGANGRPVFLDAASSVH